MGSTWQTSENVKVKGPMGRKIKTPLSRARTGICSIHGTRLEQHLEQKSH